MDETLRIFIIAASAAIVVMFILQGIAERVRRKRDECFEIIQRSNVIARDGMGYPLRLCIVRVSKDPEVPPEEMWLDTQEQEGDVEIKWEKTITKINENA